MAFKLSQKPTFTAEVEVFTPNDRSSHDRSTFSATFHRITRDQLEDLNKQKQVDVMRKVLAGWKNFQDENGAEIEFSQENIEILLSIPEALQGLTLAFWGNVLKAREKN